MAAVASGMTMRALSKTPYDCSNLAASTTQTIILCQHIDVSVFQEVTFLIRAHAGSIGASATLTVNILADGWTLEDPGLSLTNTADAGGTALGSYVLNNSTTYPAYGLLTVAKPSGRLLSLNLVASQFSSVRTIQATLSIDVTMKSGDPSALPLDYNTYRGYRI
jgi:hypothetical protein